MHEFSFLQQAADRFGSSTISVNLNVRSHGEGFALAWFCRSDATGAGPGQPLAQLDMAFQQAGAGEVVIQAADRDGQSHGYAVALLAEVTASPLSRSWPRRLLLPRPHG